MIDRLRLTRCLLVLSFCFVGCPDGDPSELSSQQTSERTAAFPGEEIRISVPAGLDFPARWQIILDEWRARTGATYQLEEYQLEPNGPSLAALLGYDPQETAHHQATLFVVPMTHVSELAARGLLAAIPDEQRAEENLDWLDILQGLRENAASVEKRPTVVPLSAPVLVCYYRRDLLEQARRSPPATWDDYQKLLDSLQEWAPGKTAVEPWGKEFRATMFLARAASFAKHPANFSLFFDINTGEPLINSPGFVRALEVAQAAVAKMPESVTSATPADCRREFFAGKAALAISFETGPGNPLLPFGPPGESESADGEAPKPLKRPESIIAGCVRIPGSREVYNQSAKSWESPPDGPVNQPALTGFGGLCAGVSSKHTPTETQAAWNLLVTLAVDESATAFPGAARTPCRSSQTVSAMEWVGSDLDGGEAAEYLAVVAASLREPRLVTELPVIGHDRFRAALSAGLEPALTGDAAADECLSRIARQWTAIGRELGRDNVTNSYRRMLGLTPRPPSN